MSSKGKHTVIELGIDRVKLAEFAVRSGGVTLTKFHVCQAPAEGTFEEVLADAVDVHGFDTNHVIGCLPRNMVTVRMFDLPSMDLAEIAGMVDLQFGKQVPYSRDEVVADYRVLKPRDGYTRVQLVVIQRGPLRECFNLMDAVGITIETMTVGSDGLAQWVAGRPTATEGRAEAVLDIDTAHADRSRKRKQTGKSAEGIVPPRSRREGPNRTGVPRPPTRSRQHRPRMGELPRWRSRMGSMERRRST